MFKGLLIATTIFAGVLAGAQDRAVPGEFIVKLRRGVIAKRAFSQPSLKRVFRGARHLKGTNKRFLKVKMKKGMARQAFNAFRSNPAIEYIEPNYIFTLPKTKIHRLINNTYVPADKMFSQLWGLRNKKGHDVGALEAWKTTKGSRKVVVAVIDTGIDYKHPDLAGNMWVNTKEIPGNGIDDDNNGYVDDIHGYDFNNNDSDPMDDNAHGTHCAGTIGASHNSIGVAGVAAQVRLMAVKFLGGRGGGTLEGAIEAIHYAVDNGAHILSNSWGAEMSREPQALKEAVQYADSKGVIFVAAAGNANNDNDNGFRKAYPATHKIENIISVAAHDINAKRASFSSFGEKTVDVAAPGVDILSTTPRGKYASFSGTSMATPHVSGVITLLLSLNAKNWVNKAGEKRNLDVSPKSVRELLISTSRKHKTLDNVSVSDGYVRANNLIKRVLK